jgi:hypothetical protein
MTTKVVAREDMHTIPVFWVIDNETDTIVGSTHTRKTAKALASDHEATTHHLSRIRRVMMTEDHASHDSPAT